MEARIKKILNKAGSATHGEIADAMHGGNPTKKQSESVKKWLRHLESGGVVECIELKYKLIIYPPETKYMKDLRC
ncbi:MAG: hypothetical protein PHE73_03480 [Sulfurovaceae bacterium]|nr:hypothetical protein [Sulfurovaceae bacterium]